MKYFSHILILFSLMISNLAFAQNAATLTPEQITDQYIKDEISSDSWRMQIIQYYDRELESGRITQEYYATAVRSLDTLGNNLLILKIKSYDSFSNEQFTACKNSQISAEDYHQKTTFILEEMFKVKKITQAQYEQTMQQIATNAQTCKDEQTEHAGTLFNDYQNACEAGKISPEEAAAKELEVLNNAKRLNLLEPNEEEIVLKNIEIGTQKCKSVTAFLANYDACQKSYIDNKITETEHDQCLSDELNKVVQDGFLTEELKEEQYNKIKLRAEQQRYQPIYESKINALNDKMKSGLLTNERYKMEFISIYNEMKNKSLISSEEYDHYVQEIESEYQNAMDSSYDEYSDYLDDYHSYGKYSDSILRDREPGFEVHAGLTAGVILDDVSAYDDLEYLSQIGFTLAVGYQWYIIGVYVQQEIGGGWWIGDNIESRKSDFVGATYFIMRMQFPFEDSSVQLSFDLGIGVAYSDKGKETEFNEHQVHLPYIRDSYYARDTALAAKLGLSLDFFITDQFAVGLKIDYNFMTNDADYTGNGYTNTHSMHYIQPGVQILYAF